MEAVLSPSSSIALILALLLLGSAEGDRSNGDSGPGFPTGDEQQCLNTWFFRNITSHRCVCGPSLGSTVHCNQVSKQVWLNSFYTMTYNDATVSVQVGSFPFRVWRHSAESVHGYVLLPENKTDLNDVMCGNGNHRGLLCSKCRPGYGPAVLSYEHMCASCSDSDYGWLLYFLFACVPTIVFFLVIVFCQVRMTSAPFNYFLLACQLATLSETRQFQDSSYYGLSRETKTTVGILYTFFSSWNLEFFRLLIPPFCISESISNLQALCMEYVVAFSPLIVTVAMYICIQQHARGNRFLTCLWKPFDYYLSPLSRRFNWNPMESIVHAFVSFLLLSSTKILFVSFSLLVPSHYTNFADGIPHVENMVLYFDPSLPFFGKTHLPYALLAILVSTTFVILPFLVLVLYPTRLFHKCLNRCRIRWHSLHAFADAFNGCYKNGTNGTRDCRYFAGFYLFVRILYITFEVIPKQYYFVDRLIAWQLCTIAILFLFALVSPYKNRILNIWDCFGLTLFACTTSVAHNHHLKNAFDILGVASLLLYPCVYVCLKIILKTDSCLSRRLKVLAGMTVESNSSDLERNACNDENNLPDRMVNPEGYRILPEGNEELQQLNSNNSSVPTYGII